MDDEDAAVCGLCSGKFYCEILTDVFDALLEFE
jgi:hypothetical protein